MIELKTNEQSLRELHSKLREFSTLLQKNVISRSLMAGSKLLAEAIQSGTPVRKEGGAKKLGRGAMRMPGNLKYSIGAVKKKRKVPAGQVVWLAGPMNTGKREGFYGVMVEKGHKVGRRKRYGLKMKDYKDVPPHPFAMPAFQRSQIAVIDTVLRTMETETFKAAERLRLKATRGQARL